MPASVITHSLSFRTRTTVLCAADRGVLWGLTVMHGVCTQRHIMGKTAVAETRLC
jgi:hypothetical protein